MNPDVRPDIELRTFPEWVAEIRTYLLTTQVTQSEEVAEELAGYRVSQLVETGLLEWWGTSSEGLHLYAPTGKLVVLLERRR